MIHTVCTLILAECLARPPLTIVKMRSCELLPRHYFQFESGPVYVPGLRFIT